MSAARTVALRVITRVFDEGAYADRAFTGEADKAGLDARDRGLAMHLAFGTVQRRRTLDAALEELAERPVQRLERRLAHVLQLGVFQILFADGIPAHAAVSESVELARRAIGPRATGLTNAVLRRIAAEGPEWLAALPDEDAEDAALRHSLPDWIAELWFEAYGEERGRALCAAANRPPPLSLWPNPLLGGEAAVASWLDEAGAVATRDEATGVLRVDGPLDVAGSHAFASGAVVPIARAAVLIAQRVGAEPGMRVLDLCAAPGGKTAVLAASGAQRDRRRRAPGARQGARRDAAAPRRRRGGRHGRRPRVPRRAVRADPDRRPLQRPRRARRPPGCALEAHARRTATSSPRCRSSS